MSAKRLDLTPDADGAPFQLLTELDGVSIYMQFRWNDRDQSWILSLSSESGELLVGCIRLVNNWDLLASHRSDPRIPPGSLFAWAQTDSDVDAGKGELGGRVGVYYLEVA